MLNQLCVITIKIQDMEKDLLFYTEILDFRIAERYGENITLLEHNGLPIILEKASDTNKPTSSGTLLGVLSTNIRNDFEQLRDKGVNILSNEPLPCPPGYFFVIEDYSGNQIEIIEFTN
ncbi:VOC family protein [Ornithinibacillus scapharcae]|uniref:VOC family protein n=1 Tax=Ornithinibacillus scapharcae TaxID=1147159 RepID=UPI000225C005|nr:VOC family protein [Ornithinibacillus scapharcae]